ncbi:hypothetical protein FRC03_001179 [Tulasnella sp. 419]|nr:hypothetical protein FRC03_001179 [Tulasnella sp. 419]
MTETSLTFRELASWSNRGTSPRAWIVSVLSKERKPLGYVDVSALKAKWEANQANPDDSIMSHIIKFKRGKKNPYTVITPWTDLYELEEFLKANSFAISTYEMNLFIRHL